MSSVTFHNNVTHKRRAKNPSFSSILLDAIYRSIDEDHHHHDYNHPRTSPTSPTRSTKQRNERDYNIIDDDNNKETTTTSSKQHLLPRSRTKMRSDCTLETVDLRRAIMIESWMEKQQHRQQQQQKLNHSSSSSSYSSPHQAQQQQKKHHFHLGDVLVRQKSVPTNRTRVVSSDNSTTTTTRDFSSSSSSSSSCFTNLASARDRHQSSSRIFTKTKSRALKIYGDLKRSKPPQNAPISPGRRIAAFLNSIFRNSGNSPARSSPSPSPSPETKLNPLPPVTSNSACSSATSFSRSCLSKTTTTTSTSTKSSSTTKRSVRFYPFSVIVDEDSRPCGHKSLQKIENEGSIKRETEIDTLMTMMKTNCSNNQRSVSRFDEEMEEEEDDDDDGESCASSDLFELENLSSIGVSRYYEELPVYGTTSLKNVTA